MLCDIEAKRSYSIALPIPLSGIHSRNLNERFWVVIVLA